MSIIYNDTQEKSELQRRITAELRAKQEARSTNEANRVNATSGYDDPDYSRDVKLSGSAKRIAIALILAVCLIGVFYAMSQPKWCCVLRLMPPVSLRWKMWWKGGVLGIMTNVEIANQKPKKKAALRYVLIVVAVLIAAIVGVLLWLFVDSTRAVNEYIGDINSQYQQLVDGENVNQPDVTLREVAFGKFINPKYRKASELEPTYQLLADDLRNYTLTMQIHNQLVAKFNAGIQGGEVLNGDMLTLTDKMAAMVREFYPERQDAINSLDSLCQAIASNVNFLDISGEMNKVLHDDDEWLSEERESIEAARKEFQTAINSL